MMKMMGMATMFSILAVGCGGTDVGESSAAVEQTSPHPWLDALEDGSLRQAAGWGDSCGGTILHPKKCKSGLTCVASTSGKLGAPGTCEPDCVVAGGECVALAPGTCKNGTVGSHSCGSGLGVECCMPQAPTGPTCTSAGDCHGALPDICEVCSGGGSACAHFECVKKHCTTVICG